MPTLSLPLLLLPSLLAAPGAEDSLTSASIRQARQAWEAGPQRLEAWLEARVDPAGIDGMQVVAELLPGFEPDDLLACVDASLPQAWAESWVWSDLTGTALVQLRVPYEDLGALEECPGLARLREPHRARARYEFSEGYDAMFSVLDWHAEGVTGKGVRIAVLDVGFAGHEALLGEELPASVGTWYPAGASPLGGSMHGTAVAEVIHDIAPDAELSFYKFSTDSEFLEAVQAIADSKAHLVNGSVGFDNIWPADGSSSVTRAVDILASDYGKAYIAAAGNENERYRSGALSPVGDGSVAIDGMSPIWIATSGGEARASLRWTEPMGGAAVDLDLIITDEEGEPCDAQGQGTDLQDGDDDPYEYVSCEVAGGWAQAWIMSNGHAVAGLEGFLYAYAGLDSADATGARNLTLPGDTRHGVTVGAVVLPDLGEVAWYSSRGPTDDGQVRPHLVAPAGVSTASFGQEPFSGTSAATPHVTGVAALTLNADRSMSTGEIRDWLMANTLDIGAPGIDDASGSGFLSPGEVPWRGCHCSQSPSRRGGVAWLVLLVVLPAFRRRPRLG